MAFIDPQLPLAIQKHQAGDLASARSLYEQLLARNPQDAEALHLLGLIEHQSGNSLAAVEKIQQALELRPATTLYQKNLVSAYCAVGDWENAERLCWEGLAREPQEPFLLGVQGRAHQREQRWAAAVACFQQALQYESVEEERLKLQIQQGECLSKSGQHQQAEELYRQIAAKDPRHLVATHNLARELQFQGKETEALRYYEQAIQIDPQCASAWNNLGVIYQSQARYEQAQQAMERALQWNPELPDVYNNLANVLEALGKTDSSRQMFEQALTLRPDYPEARHSLGLFDLREGNYAAGWEGYHWRLRKQDHDHRHYQHPDWQGEMAANKTLLVYSEQGIGDVVMFATCLSSVFPRVKQVILEVDPRMQELFQTSFPQTTVIPRPAANEQTPERIPGVDLQVSLGDLPALFHRNFADLPADFSRQQQVLQADPQRRERWRERYSRLGSGLKVGISWFGGKNRELQFRRSLPLQEWRPILQIPGVHFINLQYGAAAADRQLICQQLGITIHDWPDSNPLEDLNDFAAKLAELDLVISIDNATVHFAGALGVPVWCLLAALPDWRWGLGSEQTGWYPRLRLFRQSRQGDWSPVIERTVSELHRLVLPMSAAEQNSKEESTIVDSSDGPDFSEKLKIHQSLKPRCAIISPVGPGHGELYSQTENSIREACRQGAGPFREIIPFRLDDPQGNYGPARARNFAVEQAARQGIEWLFFLDADDILVPGAFRNVEPYLTDYEAIWGEIYEFPDGSQQAERRPGQLQWMTSLADVLASNPEDCLPMGHFVKTEVALKHPFSEQQPAGGEFGYYLKLWEQYRCIKINQPLFARRLGKPSGGPRFQPQAQKALAIQQIWQSFRQSVQQVQDKTATAAAVVEVFPEGWDVRPVLTELLPEHLQGQVLEIGCGAGRLCRTFRKEHYLGIDADAASIALAKERYPDYQFLHHPLEADWPACEALLAYRLLEQIDDLSVGAWLQKMCATSPVILIAETLGRSLRSLPHQPKVYARDLADYLALFHDYHYRLKTAVEKPIEQSAEVTLSFLKFVR